MSPLLGIPLPWLRNVSRRRGDGNPAVQREDHGGQVLAVVEVELRQVARTAQAVVERVGMDVQALGGSLAVAVELDVGRDRSQQVAARAAVAGAEGAQDAPAQIG